MAMTVDKFLPAPALAPFIREYLIITCDQYTGSMIIPDTSVVMALRFSGSILSPDAGISNSLPAGVLSGLRRSARRIQYMNGTSNLLIIFREGGINAFTRLPAHELFNQSIDAGNIFNSSDLLLLLEKIATAESHAERIIITDSFLQSRMIDSRLDQLIAASVRTIQQQSGIIRVRDLADSLHTSQDAFEKRFRSRIGSTPKQYASIVRLRSLIRKYPSLNSLTDAAYEAGYFDQSHFIKDFKTFTGQTPGDFFLTTRFW